MILCRYHQCKRRFLPLLLVVTVFFLFLSPCLAQEEPLLLKGVPSLIYREIKSTLSPALRAQSRLPDDVFILFLRKGEEGQEWVKWLIERNKKQTPERRNLVVFVLDTCQQASLPMLLAQSYGVAGTPALYCVDAQLRPYARVLGEPKESNTSDWECLVSQYPLLHQQRDFLLSEALDSNDKEKMAQVLAMLPVESIAGAYADLLNSVLNAGVSHELSNRWKLDKSSLEFSLAAQELTDEWGRLDIISPEKRVILEDKVNQMLEQQSLMSSLRQFILVEYKIPLLLYRAKNAEHENNSFSAETDRLMREVLLLLSQAHKMDSLSIYGEKARQMLSDINVQRRAMK